MTNDVALSTPRRAGVRCGALAAALLAASTAAAVAAEVSYPFEGTWVRATRVCAANAPNVRTYAGREVSFTSGRCEIRKVASGSGQFEIFEECRRAEHPGKFTETIRMLGPDLIQVRRQSGRLKLARALRYTRCSIAAPGAPKAGPASPAPRKASSSEPADHPAEPAKPPEPKP